jgi:hypothetical protein
VGGPDVSHALGGDQLAFPSELDPFKPHPAASAAVKINGIASSPFIKCNYIVQ